MDVILQIFHSAVAAADPRRLIGRELSLRRGRLVAGPHSIDLDGFPRLLVIGAGKAAAGMGKAVEELLGERISQGVLSLPRGARAPLRAISQVEASHPLPDAESERAAREALAMARAADGKTLVLCLLSGGASALLAAPAAGVTLADKRAVTELLLGAGASIAELNAVRKHLSAVKGGRLAAAAFPAALLTLAVSDVIGDDPGVIGSGPTAADHSTFADALAVVESRGLRERMPAAALQLLVRGAAGREEETLKSGDPRLGRGVYRVIGGNSTALEAAREKAAALGWPAEIEKAPLRGEARAAARRLAEAARRAQDSLRPGQRRCLLFGGETTVTVRGSGRGGRSQELALAFAMEIAGSEGIELLSAGSDGVDGPTDAAGAIVDGATAFRAAMLGLDAAAFLADNDSYFFFCKLDRLSGERLHLKTGPTGTNVMDLQVVLVSRPS